jgi:hypothetical protein
MQDLPHCGGSDPVATVRFVSWGVIPIGAVLAGFLAGETSVRTAFFATCAVALLAPALLWLGPVRQLTELADDPSAPVGENRPAVAL